MVADAQGRVAVEIGGETRWLRCDFATIAAIEAVFGCGCLEAGRRLTRGEVTAAQVVDALFAALAPATPRALFADQVLDGGYARHFAPLAALCLAALQGGGPEGQGLGKP